MGLAFNIGQGTSEVASGSEWENPRVHMYKTHISTHMKVCRYIQSQAATALFSISLLFYVIPQSFLPYQLYFHFYPLVFSLSPSVHSPCAHPFPFSFLMLAVFLPSILPQVADVLTDFFTSLSFNLHLPSLFLTLPPSLSHPPTHSLTACSVAAFSHLRRV